MSKAIKPPHLNKGDTVGIISPSEPISDDLISQFNRGIKNLKELGLNIKLAPHIFDKYYYSAGKREDRLSDLNSMWDDYDVNLILLSQGGTSAMQLLDGIDYESIKKHPKIFSGISDGSNIVNAIYAKTNMVTFHGPDVIYTFGKEMSPMIKENILSTFFQGKPANYKPNIHWKHSVDPTLKHGGWKWIRKGNATGQLVGGHSDCFNNLLLSGYGPDVSKKILLLEGTDRLGRLDRQFSSLRLNGVFNKISGLVIGWFDNHQVLDIEKNRLVSETILEITENYKFPILEIGELGHEIENYVFPIGCEATIDSDTNTFKIEENPVI